MKMLVTVQDKVGFLFKGY